VSKRTPGINIYLGTLEEKEQAQRNLTIIAKTLGFESIGPMIKWLATRRPDIVIEALKSIRKSELTEQLNKLD
jgi:hypothetical protein